MMGKYNCAMAYKGPKKQTLASEFRGKILEKISMYLLLGPASCSFLQEIASLLIWTWLYPL